MHIDVILNNAEVSFLGKFLKIQIILMQARRWASKTFLSEAAMPNAHLCYKRSKKQKKKKVAGRGQLSLLPSYQFSSLEN